MRVLFEDSAVVAVDKPAGVLTVPGRGETGEPLSAQVRATYPDALPVHRLDRDTTGVVLFARGRDAHRALNAAFESRRAEKVYLALCRGDLAAPARCELLLMHTRSNAMRIAPPGSAHAQTALTEFVPEDRFGALTFVRCLPRTGRTHQIRVHLAALDHPLLVDPRYGDARPVTARELFSEAGDEVVLTRTPLHAAALRVPHPSGRGFVSIESPLPADLARCLELLRAARRATSRAPAS